MIILGCSLLTLFLLTSKSGECSRQISSAEFSNYLAEKQWIQPACILFHNQKKLPIKKFEDAEVQLKHQHHGHLFLRISLGELTTTGDATFPRRSHVRCYIGRSKHEEYVFSNGNLLKWITSVISSPNKINIVTHDDIEKLSKRNNVMVFLVLPTREHFQELEEIFIKILYARENEDVDVHFVPPGTQIERKLYEKLEVESFPAVFVYYRRIKNQSLKSIVTLSGPYEVTEEFIKLHILLHKMKNFHVSSEIFERFMTSKRHLQNSPVILGIYSSSSSTSYRFLHAFNRTAGAFRVDYKSISMQFVVVDISSFENNLVLSRNIKLFSGWSIPFLLSVHVDETKVGNSRIVQTIIQNIVTPTLHAVELFLGNLGLLQIQTHPVNYWSNMTCAQEASGRCNIGDEALLKSQKGKKQKGKKRKKKKFEDLDIISDNSWDAQFTSSRQPSNVEKLRGNMKLMSRFILVIFISEDCSYCKIVFPEFQSLAKSVQYMREISVFLLNCSSSPNKCSEYHITGFPTLILFRVIPWYNHHLCLPYESLLEPARIDYHGDFQAGKILEWLSVQISPAVKYVHDSLDEPLQKDVRLVGHLYTKEFTQKYLHFSVRSNLLPLRCFLVLCELLYSHVECIGVAEEGNYLNVNSELFVSSVQYTRKDGAGATLFRFGRTMESTLNQEVFGNAVFHKPHKYNLPRQLKCEDNHVKCVQVMLEFVSDHIRMPITRVDTGMFHSHQKGMDYMWDRPILLSLVHPDNVTDDSSQFYKDLYHIAVHLYQKVNVALLDVVEHSHWSNLFVPRGYFSELKVDEDPVLLQYPRFCLIDLHDHNHAAFYPSLKRFTAGKSPVSNARLDDSKVEAFVDVYLTDKKSILIETEQF